MGEDYSDAKLSCLKRKRIEPNELETELLQESRLGGLKGEGRGVMMVICFRCFTNWPRTENLIYRVTTRVFEKAPSLKVSRSFQDKFLDHAHIRILF